MKYNVQIYGHTEGIDEVTIIYYINKNIENT